MTKQSRKLVAGLFRRVLLAMTVSKESKSLERVLTYSLFFLASSAAIAASIFADKFKPLTAAAS